MLLLSQATTEALLEQRAREIGVNMRRGDVALDAPLPSPMVTIVNEKGGLLVAPLGDGLHHRIVLKDAAAASLTPFEPLPPRLASRVLTSARMIRSGCRVSLMKRGSPSAA
jgi:hypothetical protein